MSSRRHIPAADPRDLPPVAERPLSIAFVISQFFPAVGGAEIRALHDAQALRARGHDVRVVTVRWHTTLPPVGIVEGVPVRRVGGLYKRGRLRFRLGMQLVLEAKLCWELLRTRDTYDVIHVRHFALVPRAALLAALIARKPLLARISSAGPQADIGDSLYAGPLDPSLPFLRVPPGTWVLDDFAQARRFYLFPGLTMRQFRRRAVTFVATSTRIRANLLARGFHPEQIVVAPNGADPAAYDDLAVRVAARVAAPRVDEPTVVCVARLSFEKGVDLLLQAWREVHDALPTARLVLVGDGPIRPQLEALAAALGLVASVDFVGTTSDVRAHLGAADVFVLPSRFEGMPNSLLEAMACGLPCVATRVSGAEDLIVDGESGLLVPPFDPPALAAALLALLTDRARARTLGAAARARIVQHFDERDLIERLVALYRRVLARQGAARAADAGAGPVAPAAVAAEPLTLRPGGGEG